MQQGAWFNASHVLTPGIDVTTKASHSRPHRFLRLSLNRRVLAWGEYAQRPAEKPSYDSLKDNSGSSMAWRKLTLQSSSQT
jgi:hypothetical protein